MENEKKNNETLVGILIGIIIMLLVFVGLFAIGTIGFKTNTTTDNGQISKNNQTGTNENTTSDTNIIQTKLVDNLNCSNSETTFNGITVKVVQGNEEMICNTSVLTINDIDVQKDNGHNIESYEFFDDNVIILSSTTSGPIFTIYNVVSNSTILKFNTVDNLEGFFVTSYSTNGNVITLNADGCGAQCGEKGIENAGVKAIYEIEYSNKKFSSPKLISKTKQTNSN